MVRRHSAHPRPGRAPSAAVPPTAGHIIALPRASRTERAEFDEIIEPAVRFDGRTVGAFIRRADERIALRKFIDPTLHQLRRPPAWAIAQAHYQRLCELGGAGVELLARDGRRWWAPVEAFARHGFVIRRDADVQIALGLSHWQADGPDGRQLSFDDLLLAPAAGVEEVRQ